MPLFDSHCHLQDPRFQGRVPELLARARAAGVTQVACCATQEADWPQVQTLAEAHPEILPLLGMHPWYVDQAQPGWLERLRQRLGSGLTGIGECGLDFSPGRPARESQEAALRAQLHLAAAMGLPVALHCVGAWGPLIGLLRSLDRPLAGGLVHGFAGSAETAVELQRLGLYLSFSSRLMRRPRVIRGLAAVALDRLLFETDAPGGPGEAWEPAQLGQAVAEAARQLGLEPAWLGQRAAENAQALFQPLLGCERSGGSPW